AKNLGSKTSNTQKPHSDSFILIVFETEITVWFYFEASFCPASSIFNGNNRLTQWLIGSLQLDTSLF
uniref:hypothetical protein n=1 Tax=Streptococcus sp. S784/96/1 TaxID=2653499 RepID=UPI001EE3E478